ncbi:hypothetical protein AKJ16_DCAP07706 [Drosera capensis]
MAVLQCCPSWNTIKAWREMGPLAEARSLNNLPYKLYSFFVVSEKRLILLYKGGQGHLIRLRRLVAGIVHQGYRRESPTLAALFRLSSPLTSKAFLLLPTLESSEGTSSLFLL